MKNKTYFNIYIHYSIYLFASYLFAFFLDMSMVDDGLRHIAFSQNTIIMKSWGEVFPYSLFSSYDPWFMWHKFLSLFLNFIAYDNVHIVINFLVLFFLSLIIDFYLRNKIKYDYASLIYIIVFSIVYLSSNRYIMIRPDLLSGLYIMSALVISNKFWLMFILTFMYGPFYYLFFVYTGSLGLINLLQKKWKNFIGVLLGSICSLVFHFLYDFEGYITTIKNILLDQKLRMGLEVGEGKALFEIFGHLNYFILLPVFLFISILLIYKNYKYFKENSLALFLLITAILWINQIRYFVLFLPIFVLYLLKIFDDINIKNSLYRFRKYFIFCKRNIAPAKKAVLFYIIAIPYCIFAFSYAFNGKSLNNKIEESKFFNNKVFDNKTILLNNLHTDLYKALYFNPTIKFVPSCSVGWFDNKDLKIKDIYIRMQKKEGITESELKSLIKYVNADFYIHYLRNSKQVLDFDKLKKFGIIPEMIYKNKIIFRIEK